MPGPPASMCDVSGLPESMCDVSAGPMCDVRVGPWSVCDVCVCVCVDPRSVLGFGSGFGSELGLGCVWGNVSTTVLYISVIIQFNLI